MLIESLVIRKMYNNGGLRIYLNSKPLAHFVWNHYNPNNLKRPGFLVHHKDSDTLNDHISNLELLSREKHSSIHNKGKVGELSSFYGKKHSVESKKKIGIKSKGRIDGQKNPMFNSKRFGELNPFYGKKHTEETIKKMQGRKLSEETKKKISQKRKGSIGYWKGKHISEEAKKKISDSWKTRVVSDETRMKISLANKNKVASKETRIKLSKANKGKIFTPERIKNMSEGAKRYWQQKKLSMY